MRRCRSRCSLICQRSKCFWVPVSDISSPITLLNSAPEFPPFSFPSVLPLLSPPYSSPPWFFFLLSLFFGPSRQVSDAKMESWEWLIGFGLTPAIYHYSDDEVITVNVLWQNRTKIEEMTMDRGRFSLVRKQGKKFSIQRYCQPGRACPVRLPSSSEFREASVPTFFRRIGDEKNASTLYQYFCDDTHNMSATTSYHHYHHQPCIIYRRFKYLNVFR